ncbi:MAG: hypothetical protein A2W91_08225 [Bacteroidetes bacterium GWF2_38_335]|nr:MAG: hypothetical protein A2W91_08225 [Bacteroidetes bacterium GWF2_38_335]OFY78969.1 MAG: hypothetical protein A2281_02495 [Bacteroidetes bacterium RIFOXYA12_FULL_38_20]HBS86040.1 hypothetical protein [Bacteroidales bacterium]
MKRTLLISLILLTSFVGLRAQDDHSGHNHSVVHSCYMDELVLHNIMKNPAIMDQYVVNEENIRQLIKALRENPNAFRENSTKTDTLVNGKRIIPVVFHVIHKGGIENISREQILDAIEKINLDYNKLNPDFSATADIFEPRAADCQIEFRLARKDPNGNCTDGVDRVFDPATDYAQYNVMSDNSWPYSMYMNVYSVNFIYPEGMTLPEGAIIGGLSPFTPDNMLSGTGGDTLLDGVLIRHDCVGTIGTATNFAGYGINNKNRVFTHESGHFFNLYHPFQNLMATILGMDNCTMMPFLGINGDEVDDTPPVFTSTIGCPVLDQNTCDTDDPDEPDMVQNFMDYASGWCQTLFSNGQLERMNATLSSTRLNLWSAENLHATGVLDTAEYECAPIADFTYLTTTVCEGGSLEFFDWSFNGTPDAWEWTFEGGTPNISYDQNPVVTFNTAGTYSVTLRASNAAGDDEVTKTALVNVFAASDVDPLPLMEGFETAGTTDSWMVYNQDGNTWVESDTAAFEGSRCYRIPNFAGNTRFSYDEFITPAFNLTNIEPGVTPRLKFQMAYAGKRTITTNPLLGTTDTSDVYDGLQVYVSENCGETWHLKFNKIGYNLNTVGLVETSFAPATTDDWRQESISLLLYTDYENVRFKFKFINNGGNNIYIDNINIESVATLAEELELKYNVSLVPNPMNNESNLSFTLNETNNVEIVVFDLLGNEVKRIENKNLMQGEYKYTINRGDLGGNGLYFVKMKLGNEFLTKKLICN